jgi:LacI family transcriptional regulator
MSALPLPKYLAISQEIEASIRSGRWTEGRLPGAREVAQRHGVSLVTASRALQVLRDRGLIRTVERSGSFLAPSWASPEPAIEGTYALCLRSTPGPWQQASIAMTRDGFVEEARRQRIGLASELIEIRDDTTAADLKRQVAEAARSKCEGVFFMPSRFSPEAATQDEAFLEACRQQELPVVLIERNLRGAWRPLEADLVATDDLDGGFRLTQHLISQGRRRIAFVTGSPTSSHEVRLAGYLAALQHHGGDSSRPLHDPLVLEQRSGLPTKTAYEELARRVLAARVDGVVCYQDYTAIGLILELLTRGTSVPGQVAITGFDNLPIGRSFALGVTTYGFPADGVAHQALRVLRWRLQDRAAAPIKVLVPGRVIVRESTAGPSGNEPKSRKSTTKRH